MNYSFYLVVAGGGLVGAPCRYLLDRFVARRIESDLPWGTFMVNITGAFLLGFLTGLSLAGRLAPLAKALLGTGFCGAYTTFSTFGFESVQLIEEGNFLKAFLYTLTSVAVGLGAAALGVVIGLSL